MRWLLVGFILFSLPADADAITRYYFRIHIFTDDGLKIRESKDTWKSYNDCERAGERDASRYRMANFHCEPVHYIINTGGRYT